MLGSVPQRVVLAEVLEPRVDRNSLEPGAESTGPLHVADALPALQEHLLRQVICECHVATESAHEIAYPGLAPPHELLIRVPITVARKTH